MGVANAISQPHKSHIINYITLFNFADRKYDLSNIMQGMTIFESMGDTPYQYGTLYVMDDNGLHVNLPIIGHEWLEVSFKTRLDGGVVGSNEFKKRYKITAITNLSKHKVNENQLLKLDFISEGMWASDCNLFSKSYRSYVGSDVVKDLMENGLGIPVDVEPTLYQRDWIIPNITAFDFISRLADESTSKENLSSDYRFFENQDGWNFKSAYTLSQQDFKLRLNVNIDNISDYDRLKATEYRKDIHFDLENQMDGGLGVVLDELDTIEKRVLRHTIGYEGYRADFPGMNTERIYLKESEYPTDMNYRFTTGNQVYRTNRDSNTNQRLKRIVNRSLLDTSSSTLKIPGNLDIKLGDTVYFDFSFKGKPDQTTAGKYLVYQIKHEITPSNYLMTLNIRKESNIAGEKYEEK